MIATGNKLLISVVIPCYNAANTIGALLQGLQNQSLESSLYEIILVDDGSSDTTSEIVAGFLDVQLLHQSQSGPGAARNLGMKMARGQLILFLDSDLEVSESLLKQHADFHFEHPKIFATGGAVKPAENYPLFSWALVDHFSSWFNAHPDVTTSEKIEYLPSLNFCIKNDADKLRDISWENGLTHTGEDVIFCHQLNQAGLKLEFLSVATVYHRDRNTMNGYWNHLYRWGYHAPFVRGELPGLAYGYLFPENPLLLVFTTPFIFFGYTYLVWKAWLKTRPLQSTLALPQLMLGRLAYTLGVIKGTRERHASRQ